MQDLVYGKPTKNKDDDLSNINLYFYNLFKTRVSNESVKEAYANNTINELCDWEKYYNFYDAWITLFQNINILHGYVLYGTNIDSKTGLNTKTVWILFSKDVFNKKLIANNSNLNNFIITFNFIFIDQTKPYNVDSIEYNQYVDNNIIISAVPEKLSKDDDDFYRIFKIELKFTPKYPIRRGTPVCIKDYYTQVYKNAEVNINIKGTNIMYINKNWINQISLKKDIVIHINMGSNNLLYKKYISKQVDFSNTLNSYQVDNYTNEEINVITDTEEIKLSNGKMVIKCTMQNPIRFEFAHDIPIIIRYAPIYNDAENNTSVNCQNSINISLLSTVPILINNEWYTRIYYGSSSNMNIFDVSKNGLSAFQNNSNRAINISGMKGYIQPNIGFQKEERTYIFNSSTKEEELNNKYIKPVPNGIYNIEYFQKEDGVDFMEDSFNNFPIPGYYKPVYNMNSPEQDDEWIDNYINIITITMKCTVDISAVDFSNGINLYDNSNMILLCQLVGAKKKSDFTVDIFRYVMEFYLKINTNYNNYKFGFNNTALPSIRFTDLTHTFYAEAWDVNSFPKLKDITSPYIDYNIVSNLTKYKSNYITIKGKYLGYGGYISLLNKNDIFNQIPYKISDVNSSTNNIELDLEFSSDIYTFYYRNNNFMNSENFTNDFLNQINYNHKSITSNQINPLFSNFQEVGGLATRDQTSIFTTNDFTNIVTSKYCIYPIKYGILCNNATIFKKTIYKPFSVDVLDYIFMCINNIDSNFIVEQQNTINNKIILAKIYIDKPLNNIDLQVRHYDLIFDVKLIPSIEELEIIYIDKNGNLVNFNNVDNNFTLEISQYLERVQNINTKNGMVF